MNRGGVMFFFERIPLWVMHHRGALLFGLIWITITITAVIFAVTVVGRVTALTGEQRAGRPIALILRWRQAWRRRPVAAVLIFLAVFLTCYIAMTLVWEDFAYGDDSIFSLSTLKGHNLTPVIWPVGGRFHPLGLQEFNLVRHFTNTSLGYHVLTTAQLLVFSGVLLLLDDELSISARAVLAAVALLTPSTVYSFNELWVNERNVMFFLVCIVLSVKRFEKTRSTSWAVAAVLCAQIMMYNKETAFLLLLGFSASRVILRCRNVQVSGWNYGQLWVRESRLDLCLISLAILFLILYFIFIGNGNMKYAAAMRVPLADLVLGYTRVDLLSWLLIAVVIVRIYLITSRKVEPLLLWDGLAFGGVACFLGYLKLSIFEIYYLAPVDLIAVLYVGRFAVLSWKRIRSWSKVAVALLAGVVVFQNLLVSAFVIYERKNLIHAKAEIASIVETQYRWATGKTLRIYFPYAGGYVIKEFGAYLSSRGVPVEGIDDETPAPKNVILAEAYRTRLKYAPGRPAEDGPCVGWLTIPCHFLDGPAPGDLVIVLPEDEVSLAEVSVYREHGDLLWFSKPYPPIPIWLHWVFDSLRRWPFGPETRYNSDYSNPDRWMDASVTLWK
jgi:hypothetical protein